MQTFETEHYLLHYGANTAAERDIEKIAALQESCFSHICAVLGLTPDFRIEYFLCDSPEEVGRICGDDEPCNGFADLPNRIYAVYNDAVQCVGFHEDAHLISFVHNRPVCPAVTEGLPGALRALYRAEAQLAAGCTGAAEQLGDGCLGRRLAALGREAEERAKQAETVVENALTIGNNLLKW